MVMGNCFKKSSTEANLLEPEAPAASENLGADVDAMFADLSASMVAVVKAGPLEKLGGRDKTKWVAGQFQLSNTGLSWDGGKKSLRCQPPLPTSVCSSCCCPCGLRLYWSAVCAGCTARASWCQSRPRAGRSATSS